MSGNYKDLTDFLTNMSHQQAADILKDHLESLQFPRGGTKFLTTIVYITAVNKAIQALETMSEDNMNNTNNEPDICNGCKREHSTDIKEHM